MSILGRWILFGWLFLLIVVLGLVGGFLLYTRVVIGVSLTDQFALLKLPAELRVDAHTEQIAELTLLGRVAVNVPFRHEALPLPLKGQYRTNLELDTWVPLRMVPVETMVRLQFNGQVLAAIDQVVTPSVDTELATTLDLDLDIESPVLNRFSATVIPKERSVPIILDDSVLELPLQDLGFFRVGGDRAPRP